MRGRLFILYALLLVLMAPAAEGQQVFSDFPVNGQISAFQVSGSYSTSNSFTLSSSGTFGEISFGAWVNTGDSVKQVTWSIGTTPYDGSLGTGVAGATSAYDFSNADGYDVNTVTVAIPNITLAAGTYYLTLSNAISASGQSVSWDINNAPGVDAWNSAYGHISAGNTCYATIGISGTCASSFQLLSTSMALTAAPSSISFANQMVGTTSSAQPVTITNTGAGAATISGIAVTGTNPGDFAQTNNCPLSPATLAAGGTCTINVTFSPQAASLRSAAITLTGSSPLSVGLSGTGNAPPLIVALAPTSIAFSNQVVNTASNTQGITVTNSGPSALTISGIAVTGTNMGDFGQSNNCPLSPATLAVNASCTINVVFAPQATGARSAAITITDNANASPQSVALSGTGIPLTVSSSTSQYIFGSQSGVAIPTTGQKFIGLMPPQSSVWQSTATTGVTYALMPTTGTFSSLCINLTTAPGAGASWTWTLYKNGADQAISVNISGTQKQLCDSVDTTGFVPGDLVALHVTPSASPAPAATFASWYIVQTPQVPGETILFGSQQVANAQYLPFAGNSASLATERLWRRSSPPRERSPSTLRSTSGPVLR